MKVNSFSLCSYFSLCLLELARCTAATVLGQEVSSSWPCCSPHQLSAFMPLWALLLACCLVEKQLTLADKFICIYIVLQQKKDIPTLICWPNLCACLLFDNALHEDSGVVCFVCRPCSGSSSQEHLLRAVGI